MMEHTETEAYVDGMGESGLRRLSTIAARILHDSDRPDCWDLLIYRVPLAANEDEHRTLLDRRRRFPHGWEEVRKEFGPGRYEIVLLGPAPRRALPYFGLKTRIRSAIEWALPWMAPPAELVPRGRAQAAMFDAVEWGVRLPSPKPIASKEQPSLFNPQGDPIPAFAKGSDTSFMAAEAIAPMVSALQARVLEIVLAAGTRGATCDEVEVAMGRPHQTVSARINELKEVDEESGRPQMLFDVAIRRETRHGQLAVAWVHRDVLFG